MISRFFLALFCLAALPSQVLAQAASSADTPAVAPGSAADTVSTSAALEYQRRIKLERIGQHYIPKDLKDAMRTLDELVSVASQESYASKEEDFVYHKLFFSFGRWIGTNWSLYEGSRFSVYLKQIGIDHPEGQIEFIMRAYHRHLNGLPLDVKQLATDYKGRKSEADSVRRSKAIVIDSFRLK